MTLSEKLDAVMRERNLLPNTRSCYHSWVRSFYRFIKVGAAQWAGDHVRAYLLDLHHKDYSPVSRKQALNALVFVFRHANIVPEPDSNFVNAVGRAPVSAARTGQQTRERVTHGVRGHAERNAAAVDPGIEVMFEVVTVKAFAARHFRLYGDFCLCESPMFAARSPQSLT